MPTQIISSIYSVSCMDPRERIVEARLSKLMHVVDAIEAQKISHPTVAELKKVRAQGLTRLELALNFYRNARGGGGWSSDSRADLQTIKDNGLPVIAVYSTRHRQCAAIKVNQHLHDQDVAVMIVEDFNAVGLELPPVFRAHLEVVSKHEEFDTNPINIKALVAYALIHGVSQNFPHALFDPKRAAQILGLNVLDQSQLEHLASEIVLTSKGLLVPEVDLDDEQSGH